MPLGVGLLCEGIIYPDKVRAQNYNLTISKQSNISYIQATIRQSQMNISSDTHEINGIASGESISLSAILPSTETNNTVYYHIDSNPSSGNYKYNLETRYTFGSWIDISDNSVLSNNALYSFTMPDNDLSIQATGIKSNVEVNRVDSVTIDVVHANSAYLSDIQINGSQFNTSSTQIYRWPEQGDVTIDATPKASTLLGPYYTDDNSTPRSGAYRWYVSRKFTTSYIKNNGGSTQTHKSINPSANATYSIYGTYVDSTVSKSIASSSTSSSSKNTLSYAANTLTRSTKKTSSYSTYYYWLTNNKNLYSSSTVSGSTSAKANSIGLSLSTSGGWNYNSNTTYSITYTVYTRFSKTSGSATKSSTTYSYRDDNYSGTKSSTYNYYFNDNLGFTSCTQNFAYQRCTNIYTYVGTRYFSDRTVFENNRNYAPLLETTLKVKVNALSNLYSSKITTTYKGYSSNGNYETYVSSYTTRSYYKSTSYYW